MIHFEEYLRSSVKLTKLQLAVDEINRIEAIIYNHLFLDFDFTTTFVF